MSRYGMGIFLGVAKISKCFRVLDIPKMCGFFCVFLCLFFFWGGGGGGG